MKKGEDRRDHIVEAAEKLFYTKGYEQTAVQDILNATGLSKGGFYHYFESKSQLLDEICRAQGERDQSALREAVGAAQGGAVSQLNALFAQCGLWRGDRMDFAGLILRVAYLGKSASLRDRFRQTILDAARSTLDDIIRAGIDQKVFFTRFPDEIGELLLQLFANITDEIATLMVCPSGEAVNLAAILNRIEVYRASVETLLNAPFGSIRLYELEKIPDVLSELDAQDKRFTTGA